MDHAALELPAFLVTGIAKRVSYEDTASIGEHWQRFMKEPFIHLLHTTDDAIYSVYFDYEGDHTQPYTVLLGYRVSGEDTNRTQFVTKSLPAARYEKIVRTGPMPKTVVEAWQEVWASNLNRAYIADFDRYPSPETVEVHVGIL